MVQSRTKIVKQEVNGACIRPLVPRPPSLRSLPGSATSQYSTAPPECSWGLRGRTRDPDPDGTNHCRSTQTLSDRYSTDECLISRWLSIYAIDLEAQWHRSLECVLSPSLASSPASSQNPQRRRLYRPTRMLLYKRGSPAAASSATPFSASCPTRRMRNLGLSPSWIERTPSMTMRWRLCSSRRSRWATSTISL